MTIERPMFPPRAESVDSFPYQPGVDHGKAERPASESLKPGEGLSRRHMLAGLAVLPAALPAAAALPMEVAAIPAEQDPVFAAIRCHKAALRASKAATAEFKRLVAVADAAVGPSSVQMPNLIEPGSSPVTVSCWIDIEKYISPETDPELYRHHRAALDEQKAKHTAHLESISPNGDLDSVGEEAYQNEWDTGEELVGTMPTSIAGMFAVLAYVGKITRDRQASLADDERHQGEMLRSLAKAANALAPSVRTLAAG